MRQCFMSYCNNGKETAWVDDGSDYGYTITTDIDCLTCEGTGLVEDRCYCNSYEPNECCCGAWDDFYDEWYGFEEEDEVIDE